LMVISIAERLMWFDVAINRGRQRSVGFPFPSTGKQSE
jgi:hypothetical protein